MSTKYLVLRTDKPVLESTELMSPFGWGKNANGPSELRVEIYDGNEKDADDLRADPRNQAVADAEINLGLIAPKSVSTADPAALATVGAHKVTDGLVAIGAHTTPFTGQSVTVAVLDTGIDDTHPSFAGKMIVQRDFTIPGKPTTAPDTHGHGTHCAGTVCGAPVEGIRVGVSPGVTKLCVGKVLNPSGTLGMLIEGMTWAVMEQKASVVSMSLGYDLPGNAARLIEKGLDPAIATQISMRQQSDMIKTIGTLRAFLETLSPNAVFVAATGNESERPAFVLDAGLPASELHAVGAVGLASGNKWGVAKFSNGRAEVVAPGVEVLSAAIGGGWSTMSGTSMATPHVAGVAALWAEKLRHEGLLNVPGSVWPKIKANATRDLLAEVNVGAMGVGMVQAPQG